MSRFHSYLNTALHILDVYSGKEPLAIFLTRYFASRKKFGARDRKRIAHLCYCFFRMGKAAVNKEEENILAGLFLCSDQPDEILSELKPIWNEKITLPLQEKLLLLNTELLSVFPWKEELSINIDHEKLCESFLVQPDLFIRIRPGYAEPVLLKLDELKVAYEFISPFSIRLPNSFKVNQYFEIDKKIVIQDYNSQRMQEFFPVRPGRSVRVWDCCAGSGGKSILIYDINPDIVLTVSDLRKSILFNLKNRFRKAGIKKYRSFSIDLADTSISKSNRLDVGENKEKQYEIIICDAPCTGSGVWSRTPEQLYYFKHQEIEQFSNLQKKIVSRVIPYLVSGGYFIYITCSVFKKENEEIAGFIKEKFDLKLKQMEILKGYDKKADSMFVAVFTSQ